jgi:hypothetical protein
MSNVSTWLLLLRRGIVNRDCLYWVENSSCQKLLRTNQHQKKETGLNTHTKNNQEDISKELLGAEYETETKGKRRMAAAAAAAPAGEDKYSIVKHDSCTEFVYLLELPEKYQVRHRRIGNKKRSNLYSVSQKS